MQSVAEQNYPNYEHIIVDDGSQIDLSPHLKEFPFVRYVKKQPSGIISNSYTFNMGHELASGEFLIYLPSDDLHLPKTLESLSKKLIENPSAVMAIGKAVIQEGRNKSIYEIADKDHILQNMKIGNIIHGCTVMWRFSHKLLQCLPPNYVGFCGDYDLFYTLAGMGEIAFCDEGVVVYRKVADSTRQKTNIKPVKLPKVLSKYKKLLSRIVKFLSKIRFVRRFVKNIYFEHQLHSKYTFIPSKRTQDQLCYTYTKAARQEFVIDRHFYNLLEYKNIEQTSQTIRFEIDPIPQPEKIVMRRNWVAAHDYYMKVSSKYKKSCDEILAKSNNHAQQLLRIENLTIPTIVFMQIYKDRFKYEVVFENNSDDRLLDLCPIPHIQGFLNQDGKEDHDLMLYLGMRKPSLEDLLALQERKNIL